MTHEELLAKIDEIHIASSDIGEPANKTYRGMLKFEYALRAVVELHKPISVIIGDSNGNIHTKFSKWQCKGCYGEYNHFNGVYPCPTIQAIEKELK